MSPQVPGYMASARQMQSEGVATGVIDQLRRLLFTDGGATEEESVWFLFAQAEYERGGKGAADVVREYLATFPSSANAPAARVMLGDLLFFSGDYAGARMAYLETDESFVPATERDAYAYRLAYCDLQTGQYDAARTLFKRLRHKNTYRLPAEFYLAYLDYVEDKYPQALQGMQAIERQLSTSDYSLDDPRLSPAKINPGYYIAQMLFSRKDYSEAASKASSLLNDRNMPSELRPEMLRIAGESCFKLGDKTKAGRYLDEYLSMTGVAHIPSAIYDAGTIAYDRGDLDRASQLFQQLMDADGEIGQGAYLYLGQIAMQRGDASEAAICFEKAYRMGFDTKVAETALYNYAAARLDGGNVPFSSSAPMLESFVKSFPDSRYVGTVKQYLASVYFNEKDYAKALSNAEAVRNPDKATQSILQKSLYQLGVRAASNSRWGEAATYMDRCATMTYPNPQLAQQARLWEGEALYSLGDYKRAENVLSQYVKGSGKGADHSLGVYDLGYALYMQEKYKGALTHFKQASEDPTLPPTLRNDALIRLADCTYYVSDWRTAASLYKKAKSSSQADDGYLALREATMTGLSGDTDAEAKLLRAMIASHPTSKWLVQARINLAAAYSRLGNVKAAADTYKELIDSAPDTPEARAASLSLAMLYSEHKMIPEAENAYRGIIRQWPSSTEAQTADQDLRRLYAADDRLEEYLDFINSIPGAPRPDSDEMSKLAFEAAESPWLDDVSNTRKLEEYVQKYPGSRYLPAALLDLAVSAEESSQWEKALGYLDTIIDGNADSSQTPEALNRKARILSEEYTNRVDEALRTYRMLLSRGGASFAPQAYAGIMRLTDDPQESLKYSSALLSLSGVSAEMRQEAELRQGVAMIRLGRGKEAEKLLCEIASSPLSEAGSEANVALGEYLLSTRNLSEAEKLLTEFTDSGTPHEYWLARGYITLADVYAAKGQKNTAREYVRSLKDNYPGNEDDIQRMINTRLNTWK